MAQIIFGPNTAPTEPNLDLNFTDNYELREQIKTTGYASPSGQKFDATGGSWLLTVGGGLGYGAGSGGTIAQATSKSTGVTLNKSCGNITTHTAALAANAVVAFTVTNSATAANDVIALVAGSATTGAYHVQVDSVAAGSFRIAIRNLSGGTLSEAIGINFLVLKVATS